MNSAKASNNTTPPRGSTASHSTVSRLRRVGVIGVAGVAAIALPVAVAAQPAAASSFGPAQRVLVFAAPLTDLQPATASPFDGASALAVMARHQGSTTFVLGLHGVDPAVAGHDYGAHLHVGPCVSGNGAAAGLHYNQSTVDGVVPPVVSNRTEVWLDFTVTRAGTGLSTTTVPFVPAPGARSIVIHAMPTDGHGTAGARVACLPVVWS